MDKNATFTVKFSEGQEVTDQELQKVLARTIQASRKILNESGLWDVEARCIVHGAGTLIPKEEAAPFLEMLGLPGKIVGRRADIVLLDNIGRPCKITCRINDVIIKRHQAVQLITDYTDGIAWPDCHVYRLERLHADVLKDKDGPAFDKPNAWRAIMDCTDKNACTRWQATVTFP